MEYTIGEYMCKVPVFEMNPKHKIILVHY